MPVFFSNLNNVETLKKALPIIFEKKAFFSENIALEIKKKGNYDLNFPMFVWNFPNFSQISQILPKLPEFYLYYSFLFLFIPFLFQKERDKNEKSPFVQRNTFLPRFLGVFTKVVRKNFGNKKSPERAGLFYFN